MMDFELSEEHLAVQQAARDFAQTELLPGVIERDNEQRFPYEQIKKMVVFKQAWTEDCGFFTPTMKIKRHIVDASYKDLYFKWEAKKQTVIWVEE